MVPEAKEFTSFKRWFKYYQDKFGLNGYNVYFVYEDDADCNYAYIITKHDKGVATVFLNSSLDKKHKYTGYIRETAKHEALHLLLGRLSWWAKERYATDDAIDMACEELVVKLEKLLE
jgi:hypothetical protein